MDARRFIPGGVAAALLVAATLPIGARARSAPADHRHAGSARLGQLAPGPVSVGGLSPSVGAVRPDDNGGPVPSLVALPARPQAGERVQLTVRYGAGPDSRSPRGLRRVVWQLSGAEPGSRHDLNAQEISVVFLRPGMHRVEVELITATSNQSRSLLLAVASPAVAPTFHDPMASHHLARATSDPTVGIADFHFTPTAVTVHVGDTVSWSNTGPSSHTATARDGSFDTRPIRRGASASHTFTRVGVYAYFCSIHPFMHGTVTVLAAASTPAPTSSSPSSPASPTTRPAPNAAARSGPTLPNTGLPVDEEIGIGVGLLALGFVTRARSGAALSGPERPLGHSAPPR